MDIKLISVQMMLCNVCMHSQLVSIEKRGEAQFYIC